MLNEEDKRKLLAIKDQIEDVLADIADIVPSEFRTTVLLRYVGADPDIDDMVWTDDVHDDAIAALERQRDLESAA